jgi:hypothetical protein
MFTIAQITHENKSLFLLGEEDSENFRVFPDLESAELFCLNNNLEYKLEITNE